MNSLPADETDELEKLVVPALRCLRSWFASAGVKPCMEHNRSQSHSKTTEGSQLDMIPQLGECNQI